MIAVIMMALAVSFSLSSGKSSLRSSAPEMVEWTFRWNPSPKEVTPKASICSLKYGKRWAYSVEIDDCPASTYTVSLPLLAQYQFSDAPPGIAGGKKLPFVGGAAVIVLRLNTENANFLNWQQLRDLEKEGWAVLNHGYWHSGYGWDPKGALTPAQFRDEMYWSQAIIGAELGQSPTHFVYPNGYMEYQPYVKQLGLQSASRVAGKTRNLTDANDDHLDLDRNYLDESVWKQSGDPLIGLPKAPKQGDFNIDFTHGMEADPQSANHKRWVERLNSIASRFGAEGDDSIWCAPTSVVISYSNAAKAATVQCERGHLTVRMPANLPGTALTLKVTGLLADSKVETPQGGIFYRKGDEAWITTPFLGTPGLKPPLPQLKRIYEGPVQNANWSKAEKVACVRLRQHGAPKPGFKLKIDFIGQDDKRIEVTNEPVKENWGAWQLYPIVPNHDPITAKGIEVSGDPALRRMDVWAVTD